MELKTGMAYPWVLYKISDNGKEVVVDKTADKDGPKRVDADKEQDKDKRAEIDEAIYATFRTALLEAKSLNKKGEETNNGARYAVYDFGFDAQLDEGRRCVILITNGLHCVDLL